MAGLLKKASMVTIYVVGAQVLPPPRTDQSVVRVAEALPDRGDAQMPYVNRLR
jgi:hypothetical protein